jgi:proline dehydrogenase
MAKRFIAGESLEEAVAAVRLLNNEHIYATLDHLGEFTSNRADALRATDDILEILDVIEREQIKSSVSIKLSQIGLTIGEAFCVENLRRILQHAQLRNNFVRLDMEDSSTVDQTLNVFSNVRENFENVGIVIQSYLYRSETDVVELLKTGSRIRICKGAYNEPPEVAYPDKQDVDSSFDRISNLLLEAAKKFDFSTISPDGHFPPIPAIATHDEARIDYVKQYANSIDLSKDRFEFQMLHGIRRDLQDKLVADGYNVRVYVPYGTQWYPYFMRRLAERPANVWFILSNLLRE